MKKIFYPLLSFILCTGIISCKKEKNGNEQSQVSSFPYYFSGSFNGSKIKYEANDFNTNDGCGVSAPGSSSNNYETGEFNYDIYEGTVYMRGIDNEHNVVRVHVLKYFNHEPSKEERIAMIKTGEYGYGISKTSVNTINGASIDYFDASGKRWATEWGSQSTSKFTITEVVNNSDESSQKVMVVKFNCKLYDETGENSITVTDGIAKGKAIFPSF